MELFRERLKEARLDKGFHQEQLAELLGVKRRTVSAWETGPNEPSVAMIIEICRVLECDPNFLFGFDD